MSLPVFWKITALNFQVSLLYMCPFSILDTLSVRLSITMFLCIGISFMAIEANKSSSFLVDGGLLFIAQLL